MERESEVRRRRALTNPTLAAHDKHDMGYVGYWVVAPNGSALTSILGHRSEQLSRLEPAVKSPPANGASWPATRRRSFGGGGRASRYFASTHALEHLLAMKCRRHDVHDPAPTRVDRHLAMG